MAHTTTCTWQYKIRYKEDLKNLFKHSNVVAFVISKRIQWSGYVLRAEESEMKEILYKNFNKIKPRERSGQRWLDKI